MEDKKGNVEPSWYKYDKLFEHHLAEVDELAQTILKCHLIVEHVLDNIIGTIFLNPSYVQKLELGFHRKLQIARSQALYKDQNSVWRFLELLNTLRNRSMHSLDAEVRKRALDVLRAEWIAEIKGSHLENTHQDLSDIKLVLNVAGMATGFLTEFEYDLGGAKRLLITTAEVNNPNKS